MRAIINGRRRGNHEKGILAVQLAKATPAARQPDVQAIAEANNIGITLLRLALRVMRNRPDLLALVERGEMSLKKAEEIMRLGPRHLCPTCSGKGYIHAHVPSRRDN